MTRSQGPAGGVPTGARGVTDRSSSAEACAAPPARASAYIPPTAAPRESKYHTIDMKAVRLAPEIDPVRMQTQLSLRRVRAPSKLNRRSITALALLGISIGVGGWLGVRSQAKEHSKVSALPQSTIPSPTRKGGSAASISGLRAGADIRMRIPKPGTNRQALGGLAATVASQRGVAAGVATGGAAGSESAIIQSAATENAVAESAAVPPVRVQQALRPKSSSTRLTGGPSVAGADVPAASAASGSAHGIIGGVQQTPSAVVANPSKLPTDADELSSQETKVWVAPSDPKAWLK